MPVPWLYARRLANFSIFVVVVYVLLACWISAREIPFGWRADFFVHAASVQAIADSSSDPSFLYIDDAVPKRHFGPYELSLGYLGRQLNEPGVQMVKQFGTSFGLVFFLLACFALACSVGRGAWFAGLAAFVFLFVWGKPVFWTGAYSMTALTRNAGSPFFLATFAAVLIIAISIHPRLLNQWRGRVGLALLIAFVLVQHQVTAIMVLAPYFCFYLFFHSHRPISAAAFTISVLSGVLISLLWPYYSWFDLFHGYLLTGYNSKVPLSELGGNFRTTYGDPYYAVAPAIVAFCFISTVYRRYPAVAMTALFWGVLFFADLLLEKNMHIFFTFRFALFAHILLLLGIHAVLKVHPRKPALVLLIAVFSIGFLTAEVIKFDDDNKSRQVYQTYWSGVENAVDLILSRAKTKPKILASKSLSFTLPGFGARADFISREYNFLADELLKPAHIRQDDYSQVLQEFGYEYVLLERHTEAEKLLRSKLPVLASIDGFTIFLAKSLQGDSASVNRVTGRRW